MAASASREIARWILEHERPAAPEQCAPGTEVQRACARLYESLAPLVTQAGCRAFLTRSLSQATSEFRFLGAVRAGSSTDAPLEGLDEAIRGVDPGLAEDAFVEVIANMIDLLVTFIGEDLASHTITAAWAELTISGLEVDE